MDSFYSAVDFAEREPTVASKEKAVSGPNHRLPAFDYDSLSYGVRMAPLAAKELPGKAIPKLGKEIRVVSASPNTATHTLREKSSPCPEKPGYLTRFHAYAQQKDFSAVRAALDAAVHSLDSEHLDGEFDESQCMWRMKYFNGADMRELHLCVYWDSHREDHCFELLRVSDAGRAHSQSPSTHDFFAHLRSALSPHGVHSPHSPTVAHKKRVRCLPPPPLVLVSSREKENSASPSAPVPLDAALPPLPPPPARLSRSSSVDKVSLVPPPPPLSRSAPSSSSAVCGAPAPSLPAWALPITEEEYLSGVRQLTALLSDPHYETRCECARALCALAQKLSHSHAQDDCSVERELLLLPQCVEEIVRAVSELLCDEWEEVCELAAMAVSLLSDFEQYTAALGSQPRVVEKLLSLTLELADTSLSYKTVMSRRRAALSLSLLVQHKEARLCVLEALRDRGLDSMEAWKHECVARIADSRAQNFARQVLMCL